MMLAIGKAERSSLVRTYRVYRLRLNGPTLFPFLKRIMIKVLNFAGCFQLGTLVVSFSLSFTSFRDSFTLHRLQPACSGDLYHSYFSTYPYKTVLQQQDKLAPF